MNRKASKSKELILINIVMVTALILVIIPLLMLAKYNYPSADDWSDGAEVFHIVKSGGNIMKIFLASIEKTKDLYQNWDGRFANDFLLSMQPGVFGEKFYILVPYIMVGTLIFSGLYFAKALLNLKNNENSTICIPAAVPWIIMEILYTPSTVESFFWYTGAVSYTFMHNFSIVLFAVFFQLAYKEMKKAGRIALSLIQVILLVMVGGGNFSTSLYTTIGVGILSLYFFIKERERFKKIWFCAPVILCSLIICVVAPGNKGRLNANFQNGEGYNPIQAVGVSLYRTFTNILSWTDTRIVLIMLLTMPFMIFAVKNMKYRFRLPGVFTLVTYLVYASELTPTVYVDGTAGGMRNAAILFYSYILWFVLNIYYWAGWLWHTCIKEEIQKRIRDKLLKIGLIPYCAAIGAVFVAVVLIFDLRRVSSTLAFRDYIYGYAQTYADEWNGRLEILHDDSVKDVVFEPLSVQPETFFYVDLQPDDGFLWVNGACATYYGKASVRIVPPEESNAK